MMREWTEDSLRRILQDPANLLRAKAVCRVDDKDPDVMRRLSCWGARLGWQARVCEREGVIVFVLVSAGRSLLHPPARTRPRHEEKPKRR